MFPSTFIYIYILYNGIFSSEAANTSSNATSTTSGAAITTLHAASTPQMYRISFVLQSLSIFISINIFDVLRVISRVREDVFPTVHTLHDMALSSRILQGTGIYYPLGTYCCFQSYPLGPKPVASELKHVPWNNCHINAILPPTYPQ